MRPDVKYLRHEIRDLAVQLSAAGDVAWYSAILDDCAEIKGETSCAWTDVRWTGVLEKREGRWVIVQMHFSFASDRLPQKKASQAPE
jgi:ketosteroid isomerase-like protein